MGWLGDKIYFYFYLPLIGTSVVFFWYFHEPFHEMKCFTFIVKLMYHNERLHEGPDLRKMRQIQNHERQPFKIRASSNERSRSDVHLSFFSRKCYVFVIRTNSFQ